MQVRRRERKVKISEIRETLQSPDTTYPCRDTDHFRLVKSFRNDHVHLIGVKCESAGKKFLLIKTVMVLPTRERMEEDEDTR